MEGGERNEGLFFSTLLPLYFFLQGSFFFPLFPPSNFSSIFLRRLRALGGGGGGLPDGRK